MRFAAFLIAIGVSGLPAVAGDLDGKWRIQNGNTVVIQGEAWTVVGYSNGIYKTTRGTIRKIGPNRYEFAGEDVRIPRVCTLSGRTMTCNFDTKLRRL